MAALTSGDFASLNDLLDPNFVDEQAAAHPYAGVYKGANGLAEMLQKIFSAYQFDKLADRTVFVNPDDEDEIVFLVEAVGTNTVTSKKFETTVLEYWRFNNGKISQIRAHWFDIPANYTAA